MVTGCFKFMTNAQSNVLLSTKKWFLWRTKRMCADKDASENTIKFTECTAISKTRWFNNMHENWVKFQTSYDFYHIF